jgi:spermidine synthase
VGVVGLGTGTLAAYANREKRDPGDYFAFYEINPLVLKWAEEEFTYLADARRRGAEVEVFPGDARLVLERQVRGGKGLGFDVLAVDAFQSDAIPIHLLTDECFRIYLGHLAEGGILAFHVTNRYLDLTPVLRRLADRHGMSSLFFDDVIDDERAGTNSSDWVLITQNAEFLEDGKVESARDEWPVSGPLWTDDFSSVISLLK